MNITKKIAASVALSLATVGVVSAQVIEGTNGAFTVVPQSVGPVGEDSAEALVRFRVYDTNSISTFMVTVHNCRNAFGTADTQVMMPGARKDVRVWVRGGESNGDLLAVAICEAAGY